MKEKYIKLFLMLGLFGPIYYIILLTLLGLLWDGYNPIATGMSEIGAVDSPYRYYMNFLGFSALGLFMISFAFGFRLFFKSHLQTNISFILILIGGLFMVAVGFLPCDSGCIDVTRTGELHSLASTFPAILIPFAAMIAAHPIYKHLNMRLGYTSFVLGILSLILGQSCLLVT